MELIGWTLSPILTLTFRHATLTSNQWRESKMKRAVYAASLCSAVVTCLGFLVLLVSSLGSAIAADDVAEDKEWEFNDFPSSADQGKFSSMALDQNGYPHISFTDVSNDAINYVSWDGTDWISQTIDTLTFPIQRNTALALDSNDQAQIAYPFANPCRIGHAEWDGSSWLLTKLGNVCADYVDLAFDGDDEPCISFYLWAPSPTGAGIYLTCRGTTGWKFASLVDIIHYSFVQEFALYHSLFVQDDGTPHISYYRQILSGPAQLYYAKRSGSSWNVEVVDPGPDVGSYSSLVVDDQNRAHISYYDHGNGDLKYARWTGSKWEIETVDASDNVGRYTSLALDANGYPHISYFDLIHFHLKYANWDGSQWNIETVDSSGGMGEKSSLALDVDGYAHISYYNRANGDLKYARQVSDNGYAVFLPTIVR